MELGWIIMKTHKMTAFTSWFVVVLLVGLCISELGSSVHVPKRMPSSCQPLAHAFSKSNPSTLPVISRHGPCSGTASKPAPSIKDILRGDRARAAAIQNKRSQALTDSTDLPAKFGMPSLNSEQYAVKLGIGTPATPMTLMFDTGSSLTWVQCVPCLKCFNQTGPLFDAARSKSYVKTPCGTNPCALVKSEECSSGSCVFEVNYDDKSVTFGYLGRDTLTLSPNESIPNFLFGCAKNNTGIFGMESGLLGLARSELSVVSQTATKYKRVFSYCLPSSSATTGFLSLGKRNTNPPTTFKYTPISSFDDDYYGVDILGISVNGKALHIPLSVFTRANAIIDSGAIITRLPPKAYNALREAFQAGMPDYLYADAEDDFDTCFDFDGVDPLAINVPKVAFRFNGALISLPRLATLYQVRDSIQCLAFNATDNDTDFAIFANYQQRTFEILYDDAAGRIGFAPNACA